MTSCKKLTAFFSFLFLLAGAAPVAWASQEQSFGVGAIVLPRTIDPETLPAAVRRAETHLPGYARQWYIARINLQAGRPIDGFVSWSRKAMTDRWNDPSWRSRRDDVYRLVMDSQRELIQSQDDV